MSLAGGCLCGAVRYAAVGPTSHPTICHCESCRRAAGAPMVAWITVPRTAFEFTRGTPAENSSSPGVVRRFCSLCGSQLTYERGDLPEETDVTVATLDDPSVAAPADQTWHDERIAWTDRIPSLPRLPKCRD